MSKRNIMHVKIKYKTRQFNNKMAALVSNLNIRKLFIYIWHGRIMVWIFEYYHAYRSGNTFNECLCVMLEQNLWLT